MTLVEEQTETFNILCRILNNSEGSHQFHIYHSLHTAYNWFHMHGNDFAVTMLSSMKRHYVSIAFRLVLVHVH